MKKYIIYLSLSLFFILGIFLYQGFSLRDANLHLVVCDVGQGDAIYIKTPSGKDVLVDGGGNDKVLDCLTKHMPFWDRTIELMILTHPDADHITGLVPVLQRYSVLHFVTSKTSKETGIYKKFMQALSQEGLTPKYVFLNDKIDFGDGLISDILWPSLDALDEFKSPSRVNELSVIQVLAFGKFKALLTGDAQVKVQDRIAGSLSGIDVLKVPHHGSKTGMSDYYLNKLRPSLAVISVGKNNRYGHPTSFSLDLLSKYAIKTLRTDRDGEVEIVSNGKNYWRKE